MVTKQRRKKRMSSILLLEKGATVCSAFTQDGSADFDRILITCKQATVFVNAVGLIGAEPG